MDKLQTPPIRTPLAEGNGQPAGAAKTAKEWYLYWRQSGEVVNQHTGAIEELEATVNSLGSDGVQGRDSLKTINQIPKVVAPGELGSSAVSDDGAVVRVLDRAVRLEKSAVPADAASLAEIAAYGNDGAAVAASGDLNFRANGAWTGANHGTDLVIRGTSSGSTTRVDWARFRNGNLGLNTGTGNIGFGVAGTVLGIQNPVSNSHCVLGQSQTAHGNLAWVYSPVESAASMDLGTRTANSLRLKTLNITRFTLDGSGGMGFFSAAPAAKQTLNTYFPNAQSAAYVVSPASLAVAATLADLNALRAAYENLRAAFDDLRLKLQTSTLVG